MNKEMKWHQNVWFVLFLLFFVLGPLGLPLVWKNPRLSRTVKIGLTLLTVGYTFLLIRMTAEMLQTMRTSLDAVNTSLHL